MNNKFWFLIVVLLRTRCYYKAGEWRSTRCCEGNKRLLCGDKRLRQKRRDWIGYKVAALKIMRCCVEEKKAAEHISIRGRQPVFRIQIHWVRIRLFGLNTDQDRIRIQGFYDQKIYKNFTFFWSQTAIYLFLGLLLGWKKFHIFGSKTAIYLSLKDVYWKRKENIQTFKTWNFVIFFYFCGSFLPSWIRIPNPDPLTWWNPHPIRIRNTAANKI